MLAKQRMEYLAMEGYVLTNAGIIEPVVMTATTI
jgi:hypothetical protein